ncbi:MAG: hypothetical protein DMF87_21350 [Acidobacteria bacterium]|nr:MAG: hypothetical protein DMF88_03325 [Acidobacteriota bacterium]PYR75045.1 MAG: hypothetical protein DMF87_21350 [Acidobacteriota bacterium]
MDSGTLREMLCNHSAAGGFGLGMAREPKEAAAVLQRDDHFARGALHLGDLAPRHAEIERAAELQPAARQQHVAVLVRAPAPEPNRRHEVALIARRQRILRIDDGQVATPQLVGELGGFQRDGGFVGWM